MNSYCGLPLILLLLAGCGKGGESIDIHMVERETKAWESAPVSTMSVRDLMDYLELLGTEMTRATASGQFAEMHHLELALTQALGALEGEVSEKARSTINTLKIIAAKIHGAGHDQNSVMAGKLDQTLNAHISKLRQQIPL